MKKVRPLWADRFDLFRDRNFTFLCVAGLAATFGQGVLYIVMAWLAYEQVGTVSGVAKLLFLLWVFNIVLGPFWGTYIDRTPKRPWVALSTAVRGVAVLLFLCLSFGMHLPSVFPLAAVVGLGLSVYMPAVIPLISSVVPSKEFVKGNSTVDMVYEVGTLLGVGMSGVLLHVLGAPITLLISAAALLLSTWAILCVDSQCDQVGSAESALPTESVLSYWRAHPELWATYAVMAVLNTLLMTIPVLAVPYVKEVLHGDSRLFSFFEGGFSCGVLLGCLCVPYLSERWQMQGALKRVLLLLAASLLAFSVSVWPILSLALYWSTGFALCGWALSLSLAQTTADLKFQARLQSYLQSLSGAVILSVYLLLQAGYFADNIRWIYFLMGLTALLTAAVASGKMTRPK